MGYHDIPREQNIRGNLIMYVGTKHPVVTGREETPATSKTGDKRELGRAPPPGDPANSYHAMHYTTNPCSTRGTDAAK